MILETKQVQKGKTVGVASPDEKPSYYCRPRDSNWHNPLLVRTRDNFNPFPADPCDGKTIIVLQCL